MPRRTYIPQLVRILNWACRYIQRYQDQLNGNLTDPQKVLLAAVLASCIALTDALGEPVINP
jgi:hypothetical protein